MSDQREISRVKRRGFIGAGLLAAGAAVGAFVRRSDMTAPVPKKESPLDSRFAYDLSEFEKTDPALLCYKAAHQFDSGFTAVSRIAVAAGGLWVAGDRALKLFSFDGQLQQALPLSFKPHCLDPSEMSELCVAGQDFLVVIDRAGKEKLRTVPLAGKTYFTAVALHEDTIYLADAGNREVIVYDRRSGEIIDRFGNNDTLRSNPGFAIPSPYFDLRIAPDNKLRIANTGRTRIETYTLDGQFESAWGEAGMRIDRFCGCCNPVFFATTLTGDFITSEKGLARLNLYSAKGVFKGAVAGPETLVENKELARRACVDCRVGAGFDVAVDSQNRVFALDPYQKKVRCFSPLKDT